MARVGTLFAYKMRFFFGPSLRGPFGPLPFLGLLAITLLYGFGFGFGMTEALKGSPPERAVAFLSTPLATLLSLGLLYALGAGVTAHVSEFDFFMTARVRPREYLLADLVFQFTSLLVAGGLAGALAAVGMVLGLGRPLATVLPLYALLLTYVFLVLLTIQILVVLRVRFPKAPVRTATLVLFALSILPAASLAVPDFPLRFEGVPLPASAFGSLGYAVLFGLPLDPGSLSLAAGEFTALAVLWALLSDTYIFHGIRPSLSAGFGQVDMAARMDQQRRLIGGLGRVTTRIRLRADRGGDTGLMARYHLIRIWRDGSVLFVLLFAVLSVFSVSSTGSEARGSMALGVTQLLSLIPAILVLNWSYYERENLWLALMGSRAPKAYFRGLAVALTAISLGVGVAFLVAIGALTGIVLSVEEMALPLAAPVAASLVATALVTRLQIRPSAFNPAMLVLLLLVIVGGFMGGFAAQGLVLAGRLALALGEVAQVFLLVGFLVTLAALGLWTVSRLAASFRL